MSYSQCRELTKSLCSRNTFEALQTTPEYTTSFVTSFCRRLRFYEHKRARTVGNRLVQVAVSDELVHHA